MTKKEVAVILKTISTFYQAKFKMDDLKETIEMWHVILKDYDFIDVLENLKAYIKLQHYPPSVADLIKEHTGRAIPSVKETQLLISQYASVEHASNEVVEEELAKMREILGIKREGVNDGKRK